MTEENHFKAFLKEQKPEKFETSNDYFAGHIDCFFAIAARYAVHDGLKPQSMANMLVSIAYETLRNEAKMPPKAASDEVLKIAMELAALLDDPKH